MIYLLFEWWFTYFTCRSMLDDLKVRSPVFPHYITIYTNIYYIYNIYIPLFTDKTPLSTHDFPIISHMISTFTSIQTLFRKHIYPNSSWIYVPVSHMISPFTVYYFLCLRASPVSGSRSPSSDLGLNTKQLRSFTASTKPPLRGPWQSVDTLNHAKAWRIELASD